MLEHAYAKKKKEKENPWFIPHCLFKKLSKWNTGLNIKGQIKLIGET